MPIATGCYPKGWSGVLREVTVVVPLYCCCCWGYADVAGAGTGTTEVASGATIVVAVSGTREHNVPSHHKRSMCQWLSYTHPDGASSTWASRILFIISTTLNLALEELYFLREPLNLLSLDTIHYHSIACPMPLLLQAHRS